MIFMKKYIKQLIKPIGITIGIISALFALYSTIKPKLVRMIIPQESLIGETNNNNYNMPNELFQISMDEIKNNNITNQPLINKILNFTQIKSMETIHFDDEKFVVKTFYVRDAIEHCLILEKNESILSKDYFEKYQKAMNNPDRIIANQIAESRLEIYSFSNEGQINFDFKNKENEICSEISTNVIDSKKSVETIYQKLCQLNKESNCYDN